MIQVTDLSVRVLPDAGGVFNDPFDLASFAWGMVTGGIVTITLGGIVLYFTWPYLLSFLKGVVGAEAVREFLG